MGGRRWLFFEAGVGGANFIFMGAGIFLSFSLQLSQTREAQQSHHGKFRNIGTFMGRNISVSCAGVCPVTIGCTRRGSYSAKGRVSAF